MAQSPRSPGVREDPGKPASGRHGLTTRGERTRKALVVAARKVFERDDFLNARVTDISEAAGVAHGTFYTYFNSKEEIFKAVIRQLLDDLMGAADQDPAPSDESPLASIERGNRRFLTAYRDNASLMRLWEEVATLDDEVRDLLYQGSQSFSKRAERSIRKLQESGQADVDVDPGTAARALTSMVSRFAYNKVSRGEPLDVVADVRDLSRLWANAIRLDTSGSSQAERSKRAKPKA